MIIDTHLHLIDRSALSYPWLADVPALDHDYLYETYRLQAQRAGIIASLHMEVDVAPGDIERETDHVAQLAAASGSLIAGAIASCRPEEEGFPAYVEAQRQNPFVKGLRRVLHVMPDDLSESTLFRENIRHLAGAGLTFDLCVLPRQMKQAMALVDLVPDCVFILDHCGVPDIQAGDDALWRAQVSEMAQRPNVFGKISGVVAYADAERWTADTLRPFVEHTIGAFGWDRVVWGSDWPVCTLGGGLLPWVATTHALLSGCSLAERDALLSHNAIRLWNLSIS